MDSSSLKALWASLLPGETLPGASQWDLWLALHDERTIRKAIGETALKFRRLNGQMDGDYQVRFASSIMSRLRREARMGGSATATHHQPCITLGD